jgi:radical SAM protein with 4Fe4S-binding SPASM domain
VSVELRPLGVQCNIKCRYCYQNPERDAGNTTRGYDMDAMKEAVLQEGGPFTLFGGEPLLIPHKDLEDLFCWGLEHFGRNGIQSNGVLLDDEHIRMFKAYRVHVGISIDGPGRLNDLRLAGTVERTRITTERTERAIEQLCREGLPPSIIITLHRLNAVGDKLNVLTDWISRMHSLGIKSVRLHLLESENLQVREEFGLTAEENIDALMAFAEIQSKMPTLRFDVFSDLERMLLGNDDSTTCVWNACDPYSTPAVRGIEGKGQRSNCGRTNKDGVDFIKSNTAGYERYIALYHTPQKYGGCQGCRFFVMCKGQCPGTAMDSDWRNRTEHCAVWKAMYEWMEGELLARGLAPISLQKVRKQVERVMLQLWATGRNVTIAGVLSELKNSV